MKSTKTLLILLFGILTMNGCSNENDVGDQDVQKSQWQKLSTNFTNEFVCYAAIDNHLYAGSGIPNGGLFQSADSGRTWTEIILEDQFKPYVNAITSINGNILVSTQNGLYRSTNNGISWNADSTFLKTGALSIECGIIASIGSEHFIALSPLTNSSNPVVSIFHSSDNGLNWNSVATTLYFQLRLIVATNQILVVSGQYGGPFFSTDYGISWTNPRTNIPSPGFVTNLLVWKGSTYATTDNQRGVYAATGYPNNWSSASSGLPTYATVTSLASNDSLLFAAVGDSGIFKSRDGKNWISLGSENLIRAGILFVWGNYIYTESEGDIWRLNINDLYR